MIFLLNYAMILKSIQSLQYDRKISLKYRILAFKLFVHFVPNYPNSYLNSFSNETSLIKKQKHF